MKPIDQVTQDTTLVPNKCTPWKINMKPKNHPMKRKEKWIWTKPQTSRELSSRVWLEAAGDQCGTVTPFPVFPPAPRSPAPRRCPQIHQEPRHLEAQTQKPQTGNGEHQWTPGRVESTRGGRRKKGENHRPWKLNIPGPSSLGAKWFRYRVSIYHPLGFKDGTLWFRCW